YPQDTFGLEGVRDTFKILRPVSWLPFSTFKLWIFVCKHDHLVSKPQPATKVMQEEREIRTEIYRSQVDDWGGIKSTEFLCLFGIASFEHAVSCKCWQEHGFGDSLD